MVLGRVGLPAGSVVPHVERADVPVLEVAVVPGTPSGGASLDVGAGPPGIEPQTDRPSSMVWKQFLNKERNVNRTKGKGKRMHTWLLLWLV